MQTSCLEGPVGWSPPHTHTTSLPSPPTWSPVLQLPVRLVSVPLQPATGLSHAIPSTFYLHHTVHPSASRKRLPTPRGRILIRCLLRPSFLAFRLVCTFASRFSGFPATAPDLKHLRGKTQFCSARCCCSPAPGEQHSPQWLPDIRWPAVLVSSEHSYQPRGLSGVTFWSLC